MKSTYVRNKIQELGTDSFNLFVKCMLEFECNKVEQEKTATGDFEAMTGKFFLRFGRFDIFKFHVISGKLAPVPVHFRGGRLLW